MKRAADAREAGRIMARNQVKTEQQGKGSLEIENIYGNFTNLNMYLAGKKLPMRSKANNQQDSRRKNDGRRNIRWGGLVYTSAAVELRRQARGITRKTPRWQPRGDDTQSFRPLVQEERGVLRVRLLAPSTRVNTLFRSLRLRQQ